VIPATAALLEITSKCVAQTLQNTPGKKEKSAQIAQAIETEKHAVLKNSILDSPFSVNRSRKSAKFTPYKREVRLSITKKDDSEVRVTVWNFNNSWFCSWIATIPIQLIIIIRAEDVMVTTAIHSNISTDSGYFDHKSELSMIDTTAMILDDIIIKSPLKISVHWQSVFNFQVSSMFDNLDVPTRVKHGRKMQQAKNLFGLFSIAILEGPCFFPFDSYEPRLEASPSPALFDTL